MDSGRGEEASKATSRYIAQAARVGRYICKKQSCKSDCFRCGMVGECNTYYSTRCGVLHVAFGHC